VVASKAGLRPASVGNLPDHLAVLNGINARCEDLAVTACVEGDKRKVFHAVCMDPLTSAVLSLDEIRRMVDEMFAANEDWLPTFAES
jgi:alpha-galactosidase